MIPEEQRIAIAELCGWKQIDVFSMEGIPPPRMGEPVFLPLPDYFNDLNACHEMERQLRKTDKIAYIIYENTLNRLIAMHNSKSEIDDDDCFSAFDAPSVMRCEAFLRTKGKWKE